MTRKMKINGYEAVVIPANNFETDYVSRVSYDALHAELVQARAENERLREAARHALKFIENGVELGYITMPDPGDPALDVAPMLRAALKNEAHNDLA